MSEPWHKSIKIGMMVRVMQSIDKSLIGQLGIVKEVTYQTPRGSKIEGTDWYPKVEVLVTFPDIPDRPKPTVMANLGNRSQIGNAITTLNYEKIFRPEHIAPATTMDRLLYG